MRIAELSKESFELQKKFWIDILKLPIEWTSFSEWSEVSWLKLSKEIDAAIVGPDMAPHFLSSAKQKPQQILEMQQLDAMIKTNDKLWPQSFLRESLRLNILKSAPDLRTNLLGYVTGNSEKTRVAVSVLVQFGFSKIIVIVDEDQKFDKQKITWERNFFGVDFKWIKNSDLTLQQNNGSLLINTEDLVNHAELLEDLSYLNFLVRDGLVVDLSLFPLKNHLREEAEHIKIRCLEGHKVFGFAGYLFLKELNLPVQEAEYMEKWCDFINLEQQNQSKVQ